MLGLPKRTEFNKRVPKQKFYDNLSASPAVKKAFAEQIRSIYWRNKLSADTLNLAPGEQVTEVEVFEVKLASPDMDESVLRLMDRAIPYHILFLLEWDGRYRAAMGYKEATACGKTALKVDRYYYIDWMDEKELPLRVDGLTMDAVYEHFIRQIAGASLVYGESMTLKESLEQQKQREMIEKQIDVLESRIRKEKQPKKKFEMAQQIRKWQSEMKRYEQ